MQIYHQRANGKLLLTSEYFVLSGADAIVLPARFGQILTVDAVENTDNIYWKSIDEKAQTWLSLSFNKNLTPDTDTAEARTLKDILVICYQLNPAIQDKGLSFETKLDFNRQWGLGSSSTLIALLADFFKVNPYELLEKTFGGSGYDIAAAFQQHPFVYNNTEKLNPMINPFMFKGDFKHQLYFVYLGKKQNSREAIIHYKKAVGENPKLVHQMNEIVTLFKDATSLSALEEAIRIHENFISAQLSLQCVKEIYFKDYWGEVKSLGAWGGDFVMMTNDRGEEALKNYLKLKGFYTILNFDSMIN